MEPLVGLGEPGVPGGGGGAALVVNDHTGPVVGPAALRATICQKYCVPLASAAWIERRGGLAR